MKNYGQVLRIVATNRNVRGVSPFVMGQVLVETETGTEQTQVGAPWLRGIDLTSLGPD